MLQYLRSSLEFCNSTPPFTILGDKISLKGNPYQVLGLRYLVLHKGVMFEHSYIGHQIVSSHDGIGLTQHFKDTLLDFGMSFSHIRGNTVGAAYDGQYVKLDVLNKFKEAFDIDRNVEGTWDFAHRLNLAEEHTRRDLKWLVDVNAFIQSICKFHKTGKHKIDLEIFSQEESEDKSYSLLLFQDTRWCNYMSRVYKNFLLNWKLLVNFYENISQSDSKAAIDVKADIHQLTTIKFAIYLICMAGISNLIGSSCNALQNTEHLPWNGMTVIKSLVANLKHYRDTIVGGSLPEDEFCNINGINLCKLVENIQHNSSLFDVPLLAVGTHELRSSEPDALSCVSHCLNNIETYLSSLIIQIEKYFKPFRNWMEAGKTALEDNFVSIFTQAEMNSNLDLEAFQELLKVEKISDVKIAVLIKEYKDLWYRLLDLKNDQGTDNAALTNPISLWYKIFTNPLLYQGLTEFMKFVAEIITRSYNECIVETMCKYSSDHNDTGRPLASSTLMKEVFVSHNGPPSWAAANIIEQSLNNYFGGKTWHFNATNRLQATSKTVMKLKNSSKSLPFY